MFDHQMFTTQRKPPGSCDPEYAIMQSTQSWTYYYTNSNPWSNVNKKQIQIQTQIHYEYMQSCKAPNLEYLNAFCYKFRYIVVQTPRNAKTYMVSFIRFVHLSICGRNAFILIWCSSEGNCHKLQLFIVMSTRLESESSGKRIANDILFSEWHPGNLFVIVWHLIWKHIET